MTKTLNLSFNDMCKIFSANDRKNIQILWFQLILILLFDNINDIY